MSLRSLFMMAAAMLGLASGTAVEKEQAGIRDHRLSIQIALYFAPEPTADPLMKLQEICTQPTLGFRVIADPDKDKLDPLPVVAPEWIPLDKYAPPDAKAWPHRTRGLAKELQPSVGAAKRVFVLNFLVAKDEAIAANERIVRLVAALADATGGLPWDEETRNLHSAAEWRTSRVDSWKEGIPDMREHIVMDAYRDGEFIRVVTLGMRKFALPDLVAEGVIANLSRNIGHTMNACAQLLAEGAQVVGDRLGIDLAAIKHPAVKATMQTNPGPSAKGKTIATLKIVEPQQGDAKNALLDLDFPVPGATRQERQQTAMKSLFGATDSLTKAKADDDELNAASARARQKLMELRQRFAKGFGSNEHLTIKGSFKSDDGRTEWMWVEVTSWTGATFKGTLVNEPFWVKGLKPGSPVTVNESDVFDYIWIKPDGSQEGNETGKILEKAEKEGR